MVQIVFYKEKNGDVPVLRWIETCKDKVADKCFAKLLRLREFGHDLRRPDAEYLCEKIYELRIVHTGEQYRILYFFHDRRAVVLTHSFVKKTNKVSKRDIDIALKRKRAFEADASIHTHTEDIAEE